MLIYLYLKWAETSNMANPAMDGMERADAPRMLNTSENNVYGCTKYHRAYDKIKIN
jgi:hypothetical protein